MKRVCALFALAGCGDSTNQLPDAPRADAPPDAGLPASTLDTTFGDHGRVARAAGACQRMVLDASNRPVLLVSDGDGHHKVARYTVDGRLDPSFGTAGEVAVGGAAVQLSFAFVFVLPSGKLLVTATSA